MNTMKKMVLVLFALVAICRLEAKPKVYVNVNNGKVRYVKVKPAAPNVVVVRPACPSPKHIWIDGDWVWSPQANQYIYTEGKWVLPNTAAVWVPGHWKNTKYGWHWVNGHWR